MTAPAQSQRVWIGIDLGTQSVRVAAVDDGGMVLARAERPLESFRSPGRHQQDPEQWWTATCECLREATAEFEAARVAALAISATSGTILVADGDGAPLTPAFMYDDAGGSGWVDRVNTVGAAVWSRLGYRMQATWALPEILDLAERALIPRGSLIMHQPDFVVARLAGTVLATDSSHALKTGLDLDALTWPTTVLEALGLDPALLPRVVESGAVLGTVAASGAVATGLPAGCVIIAGMTDGCAAQIGAGALTPGSWNSVLGTTLVTKGVSTARHADPSGAVYAHRGPFGAGWLPGGASSTGAGAVSAWLPDADLAALTYAAAASPRVPVAYPLVGAGERFPFVAADAHAFFDSGDHRPPADADLFSEIVHGVAYVERLGYDLVSSCGYDTSGPVTFTGGGARNPWWNQLRCDLLGRQVLLPGEADGAVGMAVLAAAGLDSGTAGTDRLAVAASRLLRPGTSVTPDPAAGGRLRVGYRRFLDRLYDRRWLPRQLYEHAKESL